MAMATKGEKIQRLSHFFADAFTLSALKEFLFVTGYEKVVLAVSENVGLRDYSFSVAREFERHGLIDEEFFARLTRERPRRDVEIRSLQNTWLLEDPPPNHKPVNLPDLSLGLLFKGRDAFLENLRRRPGAGKGASAVVARQVVHGLGGVGKTRAAIEYAWRFGDDYTALLFVSAPSAGELRARLADLVGVLAIRTAETAVEPRLAEVLGWLDAHPGWLLILDNVDSEEAAREVRQLLARMRAGHVLITSRIANWRAGVETLELHVLAQADAVAFLHERTRHRRQGRDDAARSAEIARELDGLALALEQAGAYIDKLRLSFAEYLERWHAKRTEVLKWHDEQVMGYPVSVAATWETTFAQLGETERRLLEVLSWLAAEPIPLFLFEAEPLTEEVPEARDRLAGLEGYSLARFRRRGTPSRFTGSSRRSPVAAFPMPTAQPACKLR